MPLRSNKIAIALTITALSAALASCTLAPWYKRPESPVPLEKANDSQKRIATLSWKEFFKTPDLQRVIQLALDNNRDMRVANLNIETAQASYGITRSALLPTINATGTETRQGVPSGFAAFTPKHQFRANVNFTNYEIDFFGRLRSLTKAALESYLSTEEARNVIRLSLIAETANAYMQLLYDREMELAAKGRLEAQETKTAMMMERYNAGINSYSDYLASKALLEATKIVHETAKRNVEQDQNNLMMLTGTSDKSSFPKITMDQVNLNESLLSFTPSELLLSRPDIKQAEHDLLSSNANIGAARAAFFPSISLSGTYGYASRDLNVLLDNKSWTMTPQINLPIFAAGKNWSTLKQANADKKIKIAKYEKAIQNAFKETRNELANRKLAKEQLDAAYQIFLAKSEMNHIAKKKHGEGLLNNSELADAKINMFSSNEDWALARRQYLGNMINLYKVLGGGSEAPEEEKKK